jgi:hypothetical protein
MKYAGIEAIRACPGCGAWGRQAQRPCRRPAMRGRSRCNLHGKNVSGAGFGNSSALIHGRYSAETIAAKREAAAAARAVKAQVDEVIAQSDAALAVGKRQRGRKSKSAK